MSQQRQAGLCQICQKGKAKYKCPQCKISYCSSICFKQHKNNGQDQESLCAVLLKQAAHISLIENSVKFKQPQQFQNQDLVKTDYIEDQSLRLTQQQLSRIGRNQEIIKMLASQSLRQKISEIDNSRMRLNMLQKALLDQQFLKFADQALKAVNRNKN